MSAKVDLLRLAQDASYAASLSLEDWALLAQDPTFQQTLAEHRELLSATLDVHGYKLPGFAQVTPPAQPAPVPQGPFSVIGQKVPRMQGMGIVTSLGQYTQHMTLPGTLYTRTLRSPHPHAKVKNVDTSKAEKLDGVHAI